MAHQLPIPARRRRLPVLGCAGLLLLLGTVRGDAAAPVRAEPPGAAIPPPVVFVVDAEAGRTSAERCAAALARRGPDLTTMLLPAGQRADTIRCLLGGTASFRTRLAGRLPDWGVGAALPGGRVVAIDYERVPEIGRSVEEVFLHELTHALIQQGLGDVWMPTWFHEGVALTASGEWRFMDTVQVVLNGTLPALERLEGRFPAGSAWADQAYRTSLLAVSMLRRWYGDDVVPRLLAAVRRERDFAAAFGQVTGESPDAFAARFADAMRLRYGWLITLTRWPALFTLLALAFAVGAAARLVRNRRRLAAMPDDPEA